VLHPSWHHFCIILGIIIGFLDQPSFIMASETTTPHSGENMEALLSRKHSLSRVYSGRPRKEQQGTQNQGPSNVVPLVGFVRRLDCC